MKISAKIFLLIVVLLGLMAAHVVAGIGLLREMAAEIRGVVDRDVVLMQTVAAVTRYQQEKGVVFERLRRISEEMAYQEVNAARQEHLLFHVKLAKKSFEDLAQEGAVNILKGKGLVAESLRRTKDPAMKKALEQVATRLKEVERAHIHYDSLVDDVCEMILSGKYEISTETIAQIHRDENKLTSEVQGLIAQVEAFTQDSLTKTRQRQTTARNLFLALAATSLLLGLFLSFWIVGSIDGPLKKLERGAHEIGQGNLDVQLDEKSRDEIGEVSRAFNQMVRQLDASKKALEKQSEVLRKNLELTEKQKKDLEKVNRELDRFVQTVSHDIRSPLMGIAWYADFLKTHQYAALDEKGRECLEGVCRGVDRANALIKDLLALTRITRVRNPYEYVQTGALLDDVLANLEYRIKQGHVEMKTPRNMPAVICDGIKMKEVFLNLVSNAVKFSGGREGIQPVVEVSYEERPDHHEFIVRDNGIGIDPSQQEEVFGIFKRVDNSGKYEGTGVGLSIVKSVVEDHGGRIWIESAVGEGAAFHFTIPKALEVRAPQA
ncbi:MAG: HAMP domain-containing protein [Elusimicrobia bacterium]|nr:HAMP domain-containing protein [Elusimicrobiota bacterium]